MPCFIIEKTKALFNRLWQATCGNDLSIKERVDKLEEMFQDLTQFCDQKRADPPVVVEQFYVERIIIDKVEYNNNFGSLGIKELSGMLNIGANYGLGSNKHTEKKQQQNNTSSEDNNRKKTDQRQGPKCTMNFKETKHSE